MIERDYIMRLIREFMAALQRLLEKKEVTTRREEIKMLYDKFVGPYNFYLTASIEDVMKAMHGIEEDQRIYKMEMLAQLYYTEAGLYSKPIADPLLEKAYSLYDYIEQNSQTFSFDRRQKMQEIEKRIK